DLRLLENTLSKGAPSETIEISPLISKLIGKPNLNQSSAISRMEIVNKCFSGETVEDMLVALWMVDAIHSRKSSTPTGLKLYLRSGCLFHGYIVICHVIRKTVNNDFFDVSAAIKVITSEEEMVDWCFKRVDEDDWE
ncbi:hypothetical protein Ddye_011731, partial [Dipteronia dyeriana]